ncbi:MAG: tRNA (adenosine(37)-N6)-dimethylallyltransferase MiaA, partial [Thermotogota bacterium]
KILEMNFNEKLNSLNTIGYKETIQYIKGEKTLNEIKDLIKTNTRNYARRQIIYFRKYKDAQWLNLSSFSKEDTIKYIINEIKGV